jgi:hypothetical protein
MRREEGAMSEQAPDIPIFSPRLDEVMGLMMKGEAPNAGRFCGYCYTPMSKTATACPYCSREVAEIPPLDQLPPEVIGLYKRMRKRESLIVNSFAFGGLFLAVLIFMGLVAVAVYLMDQSLWMLAFATVFLLVGGRVFAGLLGGWIGDNVGFEYSRRKLVAEWQEFERSRKAGGQQALAVDRAPAGST